MKVFIVVYTESTDASFIKIDTAHSLAEAQESLKASFNESLESYRAEDLNKSFISSDCSSAFYENKDGLLAHWGIKEIDV